MHTTNIKIRTRDIHIALALFCAITCLYLLTTSGYIDSIDGETIYYVTEGLAERASFVQLEAEQAGDVLRAVTRGYDGKLYAITGPVQSLMALPLYKLGDLIASFFPAIFKPYFTRLFVTWINGITGAATAAILYLFSVDLGHRRRTSLFLALMFALGTIAWPYSRIFFAEILLTFWLLLMAWGLYRYVHTEQCGWMTLAGIAAGLGVATKYVMVVVAPAVAIYLLLELKRRPDKLRWAWRTLLAAGIPLTVIAAGVIALNYARFHSLFETGYTTSDTRGAVSTWWSSSNLIDGLYGLLLSSGKGFFFFSPPALLCFWGWRALARRRPREVWLFSSIAALYPLFYSLIGNARKATPVWVGGMSWGPRYIVCITPFLILPVGAFLERRDYKRHWRTGVAVFFFVVGFWVQSSNLLVNYNSNLFRDISQERQLFYPSDSILLAQWRRWPDMARGWQAYDHDLRRSGLAFYELESGFYDVEVPDMAPFGRWMEEQGQLRIYAQPKQALTLRVTYSRPRQADVEGEGWSGLQFTYNGLALEAEQHLISENEQETQWLETLTIPDSWTSIVPGTLSMTATTWVPDTQGDPRELSVFISNIAVESDGQQVDHRIAALSDPMPLTSEHPWSWRAMVWFYDLANPRPADLWIWYVWTSGLPLAQARIFILSVGGGLGLGLLASAFWLAYTLKKDFRATQSTKDKNNVETF